MNSHTVLDAGCGYADLYPFLKSRYPRLDTYYGIEQLPEMIARASERFPDIRLQQGDFLRKKLPVCDYVLASGSLNYGQDIFPAITKLFKSCKLGLGFNLLREVSEGLLQAHDPNEVLALAKKLSNNVILKGDYSPEDFTLFLYH